MFTDKEIIYMKSLNLNFNFNNFSNFSSDDLGKIEDAISDRLMFAGFKNNHEELTSEGRMCENIISKISAHPNW